MTMEKFDETRLAGLHTASELLDAKYGKEGTESRAEFDKKSRAYYHRVILGEGREKSEMTQTEGALKSGID